MSEDTTDGAGGTDVSSSLQVALDHRASPPPTWDLAAIRTRGRRRRIRARALPAVLALTAIAATGSIVASRDASWPWTSTTTTTVAASAVDGSAQQVVRDFINAEMAGDNARAYDDYWVPGVGARIDVTAEKLRVKNVEIGEPRPYPTTDAATQGWRQAVSVALSYQDDEDPELVIGKAPFKGTVILVRNSDDAAWRIASSGDSPVYSVPSIEPSQ